MCSFVFFLQKFEMRKRTSISESSHQIRKRKRVHNHEKKSQQKSSIISDSSEELSDSIESGSPERKNPSNPFLEDGSPKPEYILSRDLVHGTILTDLAQKRWRIGKPVGKVFHYNTSYNIGLSNRF